MASLTFNKVNKIYDNGFHAVFDFDMEIKDREFIVFVGPSGCGKSTMLRTIAGLEEISKGEIWLDDRRINNVAPNARGIAMVFQSYALYPHLNVFENLSFALMLEGRDEDFIEKRVKETAKILGIDGLLDRYPRQLSGGQCQRVAVGRAIIKKPKVFLMDEPLSNLDAKQRVSMRSEIINIHRKTGATTIYVTHDQIEAMTMADRIVIMRDGYIQQIGTPHDLYFYPKNKFVAGFIGEPPMNFLPCTADGKGISLDEASGVLDLQSVFPNILKKYSGKNILMGFRPEAVTKPSAEYVNFAAKVEISELLGDSVNVYADLAGQRVILKVSPSDIPADGATFNFAVKPGNIYLFDAETQETLFENNSERRVSV